MLIKVKKTMTSPAMYWKITESRQEKWYAGKRDTYKSGKAAIE